MSRPWDRLNEAATIAQFWGVDAMMIILMILQLLRTFRSNDEEYMLLEQLVQMIRRQLRILPEAGMMMQHQAIRSTLCEADMLLGSFRDSSVTYRFFMGWKQAGHLRQVEKKINMHLEDYRHAREDDTNRLLHLIADSIQRTSAIAAAPTPPPQSLLLPASTLTLPSEGSDDDDDIVGIASPQPDLPA